MDQTPKERRMQMSIKAFQKGQFPSKTACAKAYVPPSTFRTRITRAAAHKANAANRLKLPVIEGETLADWILDMRQRGLILQASDVRYMAQLLISARLKSFKKPIISDQWIYKFVQSHPGLKYQYDHQHDHQYINCEDPGIIKGWFCRVRETVQKYSILEEDIYNMDEFGFQTGVESDSKVASGAEARYNHSKKARRGNRERISLIIAINALGGVLPPRFVLAGRRTLFHRSLGNIPKDYHISTSEHGWADDVSTLRWLQMFETVTAPLTVGKYRLLIVDGYRSHATASFDHFCTDRKIVPLYLPPYTTHLLQPLDLGCFIPLWYSYSRDRRERMETNPRAIGIREILPTYAEAHNFAFSKANILSGFTQAGLVPLNPDKVLGILEAESKIPLPPLTSDEVPESEAPLAESVPAMKQRQQLTCDTQKEALCEIVASSADRNLIKLCGEIKRAGEYAMWTGIRLNRHIERVRAFYKRLEDENEEEEAAAASRRQRQPARQPARCSVCRQEGHNRLKCPVN